MVRNSSSKVSLSAATRAYEQEPSLRLDGICYTYSDCFLHSKNAIIERFECAIAEGIHIGCLAKPLLAQDLMLLFHTEKRCTFSKRRICVRDINPQSFCTSADRTGTMRDVHMLLSFAFVYSRVQSFL